MYNHIYLGLQTKHFPRARTISTEQCSPHCLQKGLCGALLKYVDFPNIFV